MSSRDSRGDLYVGLMSGTSMDGVDAALVRFDEKTCNVVSKRQCAYPEALHSHLLTASRKPQDYSIDNLGRLDRWVGECFRDAALALLEQESIDRSAVKAIGSHGQTIRHQPDLERPFTMQIGDPNVIASGTGITTVADFRRRDVADGGQGAPLAPAFHQWLFADKKATTIVLNIGGIANITCLPKAGGISGFDTGPGNTLLDAWTGRHKGKPFDKDGEWSATGTVDNGLLQNLLDDAYFKTTPPKSTGFEYFNLTWLEQNLQAYDGDVSNGDVQATLCELTAQSVANAIRYQAPDATRLMVCGGGVHNQDLVERLRRTTGIPGLVSTAPYGLDPDWVEAAAFAWLARRTLAGETGNLPSVTGATQAAVLGGVYR